MKVVKMKFLYSTVIFASLKDALLAAPRVDAAYRNSCFKQLKKFAAVVNSKFLYSTVGFALLKDALLAGPRMGAASRNSCFYQLKKSESCAKQTLI